MVRSTVKPGEYLIRKFEGATAYIRLPYNIKQIEVEDMTGEKHTEYEYDETEIAVALPDTLIAKIPELMSKHLDVTEKTILARANMNIKKFIEEVIKNEKRIVSRNCRSY